MMKELLTLDDMVGMTADTRPARKAQVERIQQVRELSCLSVFFLSALTLLPQTLDDVELLQRKISAMIAQVREEEAKAKRVPKLKDMAQKVADEKKASDEKQRLEEENIQREEMEERKQKVAEDSERERLRLEAAGKAKTYAVALSYLSI